MLVCVDISELYKVDFVSGIQRVVIEVTTKWIKDKKEVRLLVYDNKKGKYAIVDNQRYLEYNLGRSDKKNYLTKKYMNIQDFNKECIFFDMDSAWMNPMKRSYLLPLIKKNGCKVVAHFYDIIPITEPEYCHEHTIAMFMEYVAAHLDNDDFFITNAQATVDAIRKVTDGLSQENLPYSVVKLGSDIKVAENTAVNRKHILNLINGAPYVLMVGTMEPRKNHKYVLDAFDSGLFDEGMNLVIVGRKGWNIDDLITRIENHSQYNKQLFWINDASDVEVQAFYKNAFCVAFASHNEGFGLPIIESIKMGTPVFAADKAVLREVGGEYCEYFDTIKPEALVSLVKEYNNDDAKYKKLKSKLKGYKETTWASCAEEMYMRLV